LERVGPVGDPTAAQFLPGSAFDDLGHALFNWLIWRFEVCVDGIPRGFSAQYGECPSRAYGSCAASHVTTGSVDLSQDHARVLMGVSGVTGQLADGRTCVLELMLHRDDGAVLGPFGSAPPGSAVESFSLQADGYLLALYGYISSGASGTPEAGAEDFCISSLGATFGTGNIWGS
jgi:hypothetical protein